MKLLLLVVFALAIIPGCSVPDDPAWGVLVSDISSLPVTDRQMLARYYSVRRFFTWYDNLYQGDKSKSLGRFWCGDSIDWIDGESAYDVKAHDMLNCMLRNQGLMFNPEDQANVQNPYRTYQECLAQFRATFVEQHHDALRELGADLADGEVTCRWEYGGGIKEMGIKMPNEDDWNPNLIAPEDLAGELVSAPSPPWWVGMLGITVVGGVVIATGGGAALIPFLCTLGASGYPCPSNPDYSPGKTPQPDRGAP